MASSTLLQLGQNIERLECKNRESVYLLLHMVKSTISISCVFSMRVHSLVGLETQIQILYFYKKVTKYINQHFHEKENIPELAEG